jgi:Ni2+-binding GTPase involved in maturation of urease and hydrogenase
MQNGRDQPYVTFVGVPGSGKTATAHHITLKLQGEGYEIVPTRDVRKMED